MIDNIIVIPEEILDMRIEDSGLPMRIRVCLQRYGKIDTVRELIDRSEEDLLQIQIS